MEWENKTPNQTQLCRVYTRKTFDDLPKPTQFKKYFNCYLEKHFIMIQTQ